MPLYFKSKAVVGRAVPSALPRNVAQRSEPVSPKRKVQEQQNGGLGTARPAAATASTRFRPSATSLRIIPTPFHLLSIIGLLFAITVAAVDVPAQSQPFTPRLSLDVATRYNDNLLLSPTTPLRDFSEVVSPEVGFLYGHPNRTYIGLDYLAELERFFTHEEFDANNEHVKLDTQAKFDQLTVRLRHSFLDDAGPNSEISMWSREQQNQTTITSEYRLNSKTSVGLDYQQKFHTWLTPGLLDYQSFVVGSTLYYQLFPKTDLLSQFNQGWVNVDHGDHAEYQEFNIGLRGQITSKITGTVTVGYQHREFDNALPTWNEPVASLQLEAHLTDRTSCALTATREILPAVTLANITLVSDQLKIAIQQRLFRTVILSLGGRYEQYDYSRLPLGMNTRDMLMAQLGVDYNPTKWLQLGVVYRHMTTDYSTVDHAAEQNFVSLHVKIHY